MPDWSDILSELDSAPHPIDLVRRKYLELLHRKTQRNIIAYYSGWLQSGSSKGKTDISDEDKSAFMTSVHTLDPALGLDLLLHTPGGDLSATESIITYLKKIFGHDIRVIVPQIAMSAGTLMACAAKEIIMGKQSNLGPIDPQYGAVPCCAAVEEFETALREITQKPETLPYWKIIIERYPPSFLILCRKAIEMSQEIAKKWLSEGMFKDCASRETIVNNIVNSISSHEIHKAHARHLHVDYCIECGLKIVLMEEDDDLQDRILSVHHAFIHTFSRNNALKKAVENHEGKGVFYFSQSA